MATTDERGNKLPQTRIKKKDQSRLLRQRRILLSDKRNPKHCNKCGYRIRGTNHESGKHHNQ